MTDIKKDSKRKKQGKQKTINWDRVDQLLACGCNGVDIAATMGVCPDTLYNRCKEEQKLDFSAYSQQKRSVGDTSLHEAQFASALGGNVTMQIWLGKNRLHQHEPEPKASDICKPALLEYLEKIRAAS